MPMIRVREKNQVTLPGEVMHALGLDSPGHLQYTLLQDGVLIRPVSSTSENKLAKLRRLAQSVPSVYKGRVTADDFIGQQRDAWQK
jgi:bifunctional DNA-binding transcriptional regulator/antitoxin component of YhaV-PrlF toxin-antitoxin module